MIASPSARPDEARLEAYAYELPPERIAQEPASRRDAARLMVLRREGAPGDAEEGTVAMIPSFLRAGDLLVVNDSRVAPARLRARKPTGGRVDLLLLGRQPAERGDGEEGEIWACLASTSKGIARGASLAIAPGFDAIFLGAAPGGRPRVRLVAAKGDVAAALRRHGVMPLPPYIRRARDGDARDPLDRERYQTVYAARDGSVAAPTAGLHFTPELFAALDAAGVAVARLTLHVGPGTFLPVRAERIADHRVEGERFDLPGATAEAVALCRARGGRVVAVGTTVTRVLEARAGAGRTVAPGAGVCDLFIAPGHGFRVVDALLTNFHLPRSSLLILVAAFAGRARVLAAYERALASGFRFYSYGDAMLIL